MNAPQPPADDKGYFEPYSEFAKILRTWFIAFGAGALALLVTSAELRAALRQSGDLFSVALLLLAGIAVQVLVTMLYKHAMWNLYSAELDATHKESFWYKFSAEVSEAHFMEVLADLLTGGLFIMAAWLCLTAFP
jgi:ABC-type Fe3+-siderophore transport system permease subunit